MEKFYSDKVVPELTKALLRSSQERNSAKSSGVIPTGGAHSASGVSSINAAGNSYLSSSSSASSANTSQNTGTLGAIGNFIGALFG